MRKAGAPVQRQRRGRVARQCQRCGATFETVQSQVGNGNGKFCNRACWMAARKEAANAPQEGRVCCRCEQYKPASAFGMNPQRPTRLRANCAACRREMEKERRARNPGLVAQARRKKLLREYNITPEDYDAMWQAQEGACLICSRTQPGVGHDRLVVDHDHVTGRVRGLLCNNCNIGLANFRDDPTLLASAIKYLGLLPAS